MPAAPANTARTLETVRGGVGKRQQRAHTATLLAGCENRAAAAAARTTPQQQRIQFGSVGWWWCVVGIDASSPQGLSLLGDGSQAPIHATSYITPRIWRLTSMVLPAAAGRRGGSGCNQLVATAHSLHSVHSGNGETVGQSLPWCNS